MLSDQLIPINQIAKMAGTDKIHLAYLTKLRLIPQTIRRKVGNKITGCYPENVISLIPKIEELKNMGLTYSQIRYELNEIPKPLQGKQESSNPLAFLIIGLVLGYVLFSLNTINNSMVPKNTQAVMAAETLPEKNPIITTSQDGDQPIYLIAIPNKNLYKLGQTNLTSLLK